MHSSEHGNLWLSITSAAGSLFSCMFGYVTANNVAWVIGAGAGIVSIYAGLLTIKEKRLAIKKMQGDIPQPPSKGE